MLKLKSARDYVKIAGPLNFPSPETLRKAKEGTPAAAPATAPPATAAAPDPAWQGLTGNKVRTSPAQMQAIQDEANTPSLEQEFAAEEAAKLAPPGAAPEAAPAAQPQNAAQATQALQAAMQSFKGSFQGQYNELAPLWKAVNNAVKGLNTVIQAGGQVNPDALSALSALTTTLEGAVAEENKDAQLMNQLIQQAQAVANQIGGFSQFAPQKQKAATPKPKPAPATPPPAAAAPAATQPNSGGAGWGTGIGTALRNLWNIPGNIGRGWSAAAEGEAPVLTAAAASSRAFVKTLR